MWLYVPQLWNSILCSNSKSIKSLRYILVLLLRLLKIIIEWIRCNMTSIFLKFFLFFWPVILETRVFQLSIVISGCIGLYGYSIRTITQKSFRCPPNWTSDLSDLIGLFVFCHMILFLFQRILRFLNTVLIFIGLEFL